MEQLRGANLRTVIRLTDMSDEDFDRWLRERGLLSKGINCEGCGSAMKLKQLVNGDGSATRKYFECTTVNCCRCVDYKTGSFFEDVNLSPKEVFELSYYWCNGLLKSREDLEMVRHEMTRADGTQVPDQTFIEWAELFREICVKYFVRNSQAIGGRSRVVDVERTLVARPRPRTVLGGVERGTMKCFAAPLLRDIDEKTMIEVLKRYVFPGSTVVSDLWGQFGGSRRLQQKDVDDTYRFVDPGFESLDGPPLKSWQGFKAANSSDRFLSPRATMFSAYMEEHLWKRQFGGHDCMFHLWTQIADEFPLLREGDVQSSSGDGEYGGIRGPDRESLTNQSSFSVTATLRKASSSFGDRLSAPRVSDDSSVVSSSIADEVRRLLPTAASSSSAFIKNELPFESGTSSIRAEMDGLQKTPTKEEIPNSRPISNSNSDSPMTLSEALLGNGCISTTVVEGDILQFPGLGSSAAPAKGPPVETVPAAGPSAEILPSRSQPSRGVKRPATSPLQPNTSAANSSRISTSTFISLPQHYAKVIFTNRRKPLLVIDGFQHRFVSTARKGEVNVYRCVEKGCRGRAHAEADGKNAAIVSEHGHGPDFAAVEIRLHRNNIKEAARGTTDSPKVIISQQRRRDFADVAILGRSYNADQRMISRERELLSAREVDARTLSDVRIVEKYAKTAQGNSFLRFDSLDREPHQSRLLIFASDTGLEILRECGGEWGCDGTFKCVPRVFNYGLFYVIHGFVDGCAVPSAFCLVERVDADSYGRLFREIHQLVNGFQPSSFLIDLDRCADSTIQSVWPRAEISLSLFYVSRAVFKRADELGLGVSAVQLFRTALLSLPALALLPPDRVVDGYELLRHVVPPELVGVYDFFRDTFVGTVGPDGLYVSGAFRIERWSVHMHALMGSALIHHVFQESHHSFSMSSNPHPKLSKLITTMQSVDDDVRTRWNKYVSCRENGFPRAVKRVGDEVQNMELQQLCSNFLATPDANVVEFLHTVSRYLMG